MPKIKTNSGSKKRFTLTGTGKVKRKHAYKSHILTKKTKKQKRNLTHIAIVANVDEKRVKALLGMSFSDYKRKIKLNLERSRKAPMTDTASINQLNLCQDR